MKVFSTFSPASEVNGQFSSFSLYTTLLLQYPFYFSFHFLRCIIKTGRRREEEEEEEKKERERRVIDQEHEEATGDLLWGIFAANESSCHASLVMIQDKKFTHSSQEEDLMWFLKRKEFWKPIT